MLKILPVKTRSQLRQFARFNTELYRDNPFAVPELTSDVVELFSPRKNPSFEFCEAQCFICYKDGQPAGRIAAIINHRANDIWKKKHGRFGYIDFIDDSQVSQALLDAASEWAAARGMTAIEGPLGFTDFDKEGMLVDGFDQLGTFATIYNHPYYAQHMERMGFTKEVDWIEHKLFVPEHVPEKIVRVAEIAQDRFGVKVQNVGSTRSLIRDGWAEKALQLINRAYVDLYGFSELSDRQIKDYIKRYMSKIRPDLMILITDTDDNLVAFGLGMPSLSLAYQKARGRLFPFGFVYLLKALYAKKIEIVDLILIAADPSWQGKGLNAMIMRTFLERVKKRGCLYAESNPELETNTQINEQWSYFDTQTHKRRRIYSRKF